MKPPQTEGRLGAGLAGVGLGGGGGGGGGAGVGGVGVCVCWGERVMRYLNYTGKHDKIYFR